MGLKRFFSILTAPWRLAELVEQYVSAQNQMVHEIMAVSRVQAETNAKMAEFIQAIQVSMIVDGPVEGRPGLSDEEELAQMVQLQRVTYGKGES